MLYSRAASSVGVMYRSSGPNTGSNSGGGWIQKNDKLGVKAIANQNIKIFAINIFQKQETFLCIITVVHISSKDLAFFYFAFCHIKFAESEPAKFNKK